MKRFVECVPFSTGESELAEQKRTLIITGAAGGMGRAICGRLSSLYDVIAVDHHPEKLPGEVAQSVRTVKAELSRPDWLEALHHPLEGKAVYGVINLAGASIGDSIEKISDEDWYQSFDINVTAAMKLIRYAIPHFRAQGRGRVINVGSPVGLVGARKCSYAASKAALQGLTLSAARELGKYRVCVNLLLPGPTITDMTADWDDTKRQAIAGGTFLNRLCQPGEIAEMLAFLLSDACAYMTGAVVDMTAGSMWGH